MVEFSLERVRAARGVIWAVRFSLGNVMACQSCQKLLD